MLMSLTMRCLPMPPVDSRGTTSDVAIPIPSFSFSGQNPTAQALVDCGGRNPLNYTALLAAESRPLPRLEPGGTCLCTRKKSADSLFGLEELGDVAELIIS